MKNTARIASNHEPNHGYQDRIITISYRRYSESKTSQTPITSHLKPLTDVSPSSTNRQIHILYYYNVEQAGTRCGKLKKELSRPGDCFGKH